MNPEQQAHSYTLLLGYACPGWILCYLTSYACGSGNHKPPQVVLAEVLWVKKPNSYHNRSLPGKDLP